MKKKTYVLMVSTHFPAYHFRKGEETLFEEKIKSGIKIHTIRQNYPLWKKRAEKINKGEAVLSLRKWEAKPRRSKMIEIAQLEKIGVQSIRFDHGLTYIDNYPIKYLWVDRISKNDGLSVSEFDVWFNGSLNELNAIIYFTNFRYSGDKT